MTVSLVNRAQESSKFNQTMTAHGKMCQNIDVRVPLQQIKSLCASVYIHNTNEIKSAMIGGGTVSQHFNQGILNNLEIEITWTNRYAQTFQNLQEWALRNAPDCYSMDVHVYKLLPGEDAKRYNAS